MFSTAFFCYPFWFADRYLKIKSAWGASYELDIHDKPAWQRFLQLCDKLQNKSYELSQLTQCLVPQLLKLLIGYHSITAPQQQQLVRLTN